MPWPVIGCDLFGTNPKINTGYKRREAPPLRSVGALMASSVLRMRSPSAIGSNSEFSTKVVSPHRTFVAATTGRVCTTSCSAA
jgi:hypothetical protein